MKLKVLSLLVLSLPACALGPARTEQPVEGWKIDYEDATLYRTTPTGEDWMEIKNNLDVLQFMCFEVPDTTEVILRGKDK